MIDLTKLIYVRQPFCSHGATDCFVPGAAYTADADSEDGSFITLRGPAYVKRNDEISHRNNHYMVAEISNCSNTPWPIESTKEPVQDKPLNDRIAELYLEAIALLPNSLVPYYLKEALQKADGDLRFVQRKAEGIA